ncbi:MAG: peroxidase family protein [Actinomycetes bacterium]
MSRTIRVLSFAASALLALALPAVSGAKHSSPGGQGATHADRGNVRQKPPRRPLPLPLRPAPPATDASYSITGVGNNLGNPSWGSVNVDLLRFVASAYADGRSAAAGGSRPNARALSNALSTQSEDAPENNRQMSDFLYVFGQFLDHDIGLSTTGSESMPIAVPSGDPFFDPAGTGTKRMPLSRSAFNPASGTNNPRQQTNTITAFIDGSQVYGSDAARAAALRTFSAGKLKTSAGNMMPFNTEGLPNANDAHFVADSRLFLGGDVRANENVELTAIQTLFVREHNRQAAAIAANSPSLSDEQIYQQARRIVIGELQAITYNEFLPALLGQGAVAGYRGYQRNVNPGIANEFSTAAFRFGHSMLDGEIGRLNDDGSDTPQGPIPLRNAFFNPTVFDTSLPNHQGDIDPFLKSAASGNTQEVDLQIVDDVRNFLFGAPGSGGFDLAALNIQRGRDHGLADYNTVRAAYGLPRVTSFAQISSNPATAAALQAAYGSVSNIDLWVGGLAEDHTARGSLGPLFTRVVASQFARLRDGDRFYYENSLRGPQLDQVRHATLSRVIRANTALTSVQPNAFFAPAGGS